MYRFQVELMLNAGAEADAQDSDGWTALMLAAEAGCGGCVRILVETGADPMLTHSDGESAVTLATNAGHLSVLNELSTHERAALRQTDDDRITQNGNGDPWSDVPS